ncbi:hypothetical protein Peur_001218 [Populus x canadensis]
MHGEWHVVKRNRKVDGNGIKGAKLKGNNIIPKRNKFDTLTEEKEPVLNISDHIENGLDIDSKSLGPMGSEEFKSSSFNKPYEGPFSNAVDSDRIFDGIKNKR